MSNAHKSSLGSLLRLAADLERDPQLEGDWDWAQVAEALETAPDIEDGDDWEVADYVFDTLSAGDSDDDDNGGADNGDGKPRNPKNNPNGSMRNAEC